MMHIGQYQFQILIWWYIGWYVLKYWDDHILDWSELTCQICNPGYEMW
jgi:hypothetical protein